MPISRLRPALVEAGTKLYVRLKRVGKPVRRAVAVDPMTEHRWLNSMG
jgi:hypothetical protein